MRSTMILYISLLHAHTFKDTAIKKKNSHLLLSE